MLWLVEILFIEPIFQLIIYLTEHYWYSGYKAWCITIYKIWRLPVVCLIFIQHKSLIKYFDIFIEYTFLKDLNFENIRAGMEVRVDCRRNIRLRFLYRFFMQWSVKKDVLFEDQPDRSSRLLAQRNLEPVKIVQSVSCNPPGPAVILPQIYNFFIRTIITSPC